MTSYQEKYAELKSLLENFGSVIVAYSGGVDSTLLLKAAVERLGDKALAVTVNSPIHPEIEIEEARKIAGQLGAQHMVIENNELENADFVANPIDRCYICKKERFTILGELQKRTGFAALVEGSNVDDAGDYRPGSRAVDELGVRSPLKEVGLTKDAIRLLSKDLGLPTWDRPSSPCLATRVPYGQMLTPELMERIKKAEAFLKDKGFREVRVRVHGTIARIEIPRKDFSRLTATAMMDDIINYFHELDFAYITLDMRGFRSGSMNEVLGDTERG